MPARERQGTLSTSDPARPGQSGERAVVGQAGQHGDRGRRAGTVIGLACRARTRKEICMDGVRDITTKLHEKTYLIEV